MLASHYPKAYGPESAVRWQILPEDLYQFLFARCCKNTIRIILALLQARTTTNPPISCGGATKSCDGPLA